MTEGRDAGTFTWPVRVYYEDTDAAGVVYYANYLKFFERARSEWLRGLGFEQTALAHEHGVVFVVRSLAIEYLLPARFNDDVHVRFATGDAEKVDNRLPPDTMCPRSRRRQRGAWTR